jgi:hypothetical protein
MTIQQLTANRSYPKPNVANQLVVDVERLRLALDAIDTDMASRPTVSAVEALIAAAIANVIAGAPGALDTLDELAAALGDNANFSAVVTNSLAQINSALGERYTKAESDARYVQGAVQVETLFTASSGQVAFGLTSSIINKPSALVTVDGVVQPTSEYSISQDGLTLTLSEAPGTGAKVRVLALSVASAGAPADDTITTPKLRDDAVTIPKLAFEGGAFSGFRNAIINGNFDVWQRRTSFSGSQSGFAADRWQTVVIGSSHNTSRQDFTLGQTAVPGNPRHFCRVVVTSAAGASNGCYLRQAIEDVRTFAGQTVTITFEAKADAARPIAVELIQQFGTLVTLLVTGIGVTKTTLSTDWQLVTVTAQVPSIANKALGNDSDTSLELLIWFDAGSAFNARTASLGQQSGTFDIAQVQVAPGPAPTPFERRPLGVELDLCQRYYEETHYAIPASGLRVMGQWATKKRTTPDIQVEEVLDGSGGTMIAVGVNAFRVGTYATTEARVRISGSAEI